MRNQMPSTSPTDFTLQAVTTALLAEHRRLGSWSKVAAEYHRPKGTLCRIATEPGYCPGWLKRNIQALTPWRDLLAMPRDELKWRLENRE